MSADYPEQATTEPMEPEPDLPEAVAETLHELASGESLELSMMYCLGDCTLPDGAPLMSFSVDTAFGSISFVDDGYGVRWVTWQAYADCRAGARRVGPAEDADALALFCFGILLAPACGAARSLVCH